jgi:hypothetical protein
MSITALDLIRKPESATPFLVDHLIPEKSLCLFSGDAGSCKSAFMLHSALAMLTGKPVGGRLQTNLRQDQHVLYFNAEMTQDLRGYILKASAGLELTKPEQDVAFQRLRFGGCDGFQQLSGAPLGFDLDPLDWELRQTQGIRLVIIDTLFSAFSIDANDAKAVGALYAELRRKIMSYGLSVVVVHHHKKRGMYPTKGADRAAGSGFLNGGVDSHFAAFSSGTNKTMNALTLEKTRRVKSGIGNGYKWNVEAQGTDTESRFLLSGGGAGLKIAAGRGDLHTKARELFAQPGLYRISRRELVEHLGRGNFEALVEEGLLKQSDHQPGDAKAYFYELRIRAVA